jgi:hypothetical protein
LDIEAEERNCHTQVLESGTSYQGLGNVGTVKVSMVSRVLRVRRDVDRSVMLGVVSGCVEVQGLMEAKGSETKEATGSDDDDGRVETNVDEEEADVGGRDRRSDDGDRGSEVGMTWS